jgi:hypothetical protein
MEFLSASYGSGAWTLGIVTATQVCHERKTLVIVDADRQFYLAGAVRLGLELNRCIVLHPANRQDAYRALVQALRCTAVGAVLGWQEWLSMRQLRRLQLAAEAGGGTAILLRPMKALHVPSCAAVRLLVSPVPLQGVGSLFRSMKNQQSSITKKDFRSCEAKPETASGSSGCFVRHVQVQVVRCRGRAAGQSLVLEIDDEAGHVRTPASMAAAAVTARSARASG